LYNAFNKTFTADFAHFDDLIGEYKDTEQFEDTKEVIRIRISKKNRQYNGQRFEDTNKVIRIRILKKNRQQNGQNCSILSQNMPKFELLKHNDELLNIYYGIFYEL
jgi:hypothetical protein